MPLKQISNDDVELSFLSHTSENRINFLKQLDIWLMLKLFHKDQKNPNAICV